MSIWGADDARVHAQDDARDIGAIEYPEATVWPERPLAVVTPINRVKVQTRTQRVHVAWGIRFMTWVLAWGAVIGGVVFVLLIIRAVNQ